MLGLLSNIPDVASGQMGSGTRNRLIEYTQAALAVGFAGGYVAASLMGNSAADGLKDFSLIIVGFYFAKRADFSGANGKQ